MFTGSLVQRIILVEGLFKGILFEIFPSLVVILGRSLICKFLTQLILKMLYLALDNLQRFASVFDEFFSNPNV